MCTRVLKLRLFEIDPESAVTFFICFFCYLYKIIYIYMRVFFNIYTHNFHKLDAVNTQCTFDPALRIKRKPDKQNKTVKMRALRCLINKNLFKFERKIVWNNRQAIKIVGMKTNAHINYNYPKSIKAKIKREQKQKVWGIESHTTTTTATTQKKKQTKKKIIIK